MLVLGVALVLASRLLDLPPQAGQVGAVLLVLGLLTSLLVSTGRLEPSEDRGAAGIRRW